MFIIDRMQVPVCKRVRAGRCRKLRGKRYFGRCAAKDETYFGWRLPLVCSSDGLPVAFDIMPAAWHDLTGVQWLTAELPAGAPVVGDKGYNSDLDETLCDYYDNILLPPKRRKNMVQDIPEHQALLRRFRPVIETSQSAREDGRSTAPCAHQSRLVSQAVCFSARLALQSVCLAIKVIVGISV